MRKESMESVCAWVQKEASAGPRERACTGTFGTVYTRSGPTGGSDKRGRVEMFDLEEIARRKHGDAERTGLRTQG